MKVFRVLGFFLLILFFFAGCQEMPTGSYDSQRTFQDSLKFGIFSEFSRYEGPFRPPVIIVHGLLGARLKDSGTGEVVWGEFSPSGFDNNFFKSLAHPMRRGAPLAEITDKVVPENVMLFAEIKLFGMTFEHAGYAGLINTLRSAGYATESDYKRMGKHYPTLFLFAYDWRRSPIENAARLSEFIREKRSKLMLVYAREFGLRGHDVRFDLIAHSMGGLISRYYLMYGAAPLPTDGSLPELTWAGARYLNRIAIVATPNAGYVDTVLEMSGGLKLNAAAPMIPPAVIATFPSYYAMLPSASAGGEVRDRHGDVLDLFDMNTWITYKWGLADPKQDKTLKILLPAVSDVGERRAIALDHLEKCLNLAKRFSAALAVDAPPPPEVTLALFAGDAVPTSKIAEASLTGEIKVIEFDAGDGKALGSSARYDRFLGEGWKMHYDSPIKWDFTVYVPAAHMGITKSNTFASNLLAFLLLITPDNPEDFNSLKVQ